jgi:hypothetical protein
MVVGTAPWRAEYARAVVSRLSLVALAALIAGAACFGDNSPPPPPAGVLDLAGHHDLGGRGMNSALAIVGDHVYVGSRTGGNHPDAGIAIVDVSDPFDPEMVGMIGEPDVALSSMSSRELRAIPHKRQLVVLHFACGEIHDCPGNPPEPDSIKVFDVSEPARPTLLGVYPFGVTGIDPARPHELYLWQDPADADRILLFLSTPIGPPAFTVVDISDPTAMVEAYTWDPIRDGGLPVARNEFSVLHSVAVSDDGTVGYFSSEGAGFYLVDTSDIAAGAAVAEIELITPGENRLDYSPPHPTGVHSAVPVPGRDLVVLTDEVYPKPAFPGCPWGWMRLVDVSDPTAPTQVGEHKHEKNVETCDIFGGPERVTYTAHNTTNTANLSFVTWHSAGLQVIATTDPTNPRRVAEFVPEPLDAVATEDPVLGGHPVLMWSTPVLYRGFIYVTDIRNGLYILRYTGSFEDEVTAAGFAEGNSNL